MAKVYASLIQKGLKTMEEVPASMREQVADLLRGE